MGLNKLILQQSTVLTLVGIFFQLFGLIFLLLVAKKFGATFQVDAYYYIIGFHFFIITIVQNVFKLVLIPILVKEKANNPDQINLLFNNLFYYISLFSIILTILLIIAVKLGFFQFFFPNHYENDYYENLFVLSSPLIFLNVSSSVLNNIYNSFQKFWLFEVINNSKLVINLLFFYFFSDIYEINSLIFGSILGQFFVLILFIYFLNKSSFFSFQFNFKLHNSIKQIFKLSFFPVLSTLIVAIQPIIANFYLTKSNISGNLSLFNYSQKLASIPTLIFSAGMLTVFVSHISLLDANGNESAIKNTSSKSISFLFSFLLPIIAFIYCSKFNLISFLFQGNSFTLDQLVNISDTTMLLLVSLMFLQVHSLIARIFIAKQNTYLLFILSFAGLCIQLISLYFLVYKFQFLKYGVPLSLIITNFVIFCLSVFYVVFKYDLLDIKYISKNLLLSFTFSILVVSFCFFLDLDNWSFNSNLIYVIFSKFVFIFLTYFFLLFLFKQSDFMSLYLYLKNKVILR